MTGFSMGGAISMIGFIEPGTLEDNTCRKDDPANIGPAFGANRQRLIAHSLPDFKAVAAALTQILIGWHTLLTSKRSLYALNTLCAPIGIHSHYLYSVFTLNCQSGSSSASTIIL